MKCVGGIRIIPAAQNRALLRRTPRALRNDPLADDEQKIGDNDHLAALVTNLASADLLVILSSAPGVLGVGAAENDPEEAAIVVFFESPSGTVPKTLPTELAGTKVRVILTDPIVAQ